MTARCIPTVLYIFRCCLSTDGDDGIAGSCRLLLSLPCCPFHSLRKRSQLWSECPVVIKYVTHSDERLLYLCRLSGTVSYQLCRTPPLLTSTSCQMWLMRQTLCCLNGAMPQQSAHLSPCQQWSPRLRSCCLSFSPRPQQSSCPTSGWKSQPRSSCSQPTRSRFNACYPACVPSVLTC